MRLEPIPAGTGGHVQAHIGGASMSWRLFIPPNRGQSSRCLNDALREEDHRLPRGRVALESYRGINRFGDEVLYRYCGEHIHVEHAMELEGMRL